MTDPTPWLQERYRRQIEQQKLPLQLQSMALQNQASQLAIEHQGMQNDIAHLDLNSFRDDLDKIKQFGADTGGDPIKMMETPPPNLLSVQGQKLLSNQINQASNVGFAQRHQALETAKIAIASKAWELGEELPMSPDPITGKPSFSREDIVNAFNSGKLRDIVSKAFLEQAKVPQSQENIIGLDQAKSALAQAQATGDQSKIQAAQQHLQSVLTYAPGQQMTVFDPVTHLPLVQTGRQDIGDLTKATQTEEEKKVLNSEQVVGDLTRARDQLNDENVLGIFPTFKNKIFDKLMGNIAPEFVNKERVKGRAAVDWSKQDMLNAMRQRYGEKAVERLGSALPSTGFMESPENARIVTDSLITTISEDAANRALAIGRPPAEHVLRALSRLSNDELEKEMSTGYLRPSVGIAAVQIRKLPPGSMPQGFESKPSGKPMVVAPTTAPTSPQGVPRVTWDQLFNLYKSGKLKNLSSEENQD